MIKLSLIIKLKLNNNNKKKKRKKKGKFTILSSISANRRITIQNSDISALPSLPFDFPNLLKYKK